ncbi:MAG: hypothetical protein KF852_00080 [Saprospiraceae bacterium]|nr:hypothetical protein [Saprospiraceae bacterium]
MYILNSIELLELQYAPPHGIDEPTLQHARAKLLSRIDREGDAALQYMGRSVSRQELEEALDLLDHPNAVEAFYRLLRYPGLSSVLAGAGGTVEPEVSADEPLKAFLAPLLQPQLAAAWPDAVRLQDTAQLSTLAALDPDLLGIPAAEVLGAARAHVESYVAEFEHLARSIAAHPEQPLPQELVGGYFLRKHFGADFMNALPHHFNDLKIRICNGLIIICKALQRADTSTAMGMSAFGLEIAPNEHIKGVFYQVKNRLQKANQTKEMGRLQSGNSNQTLLVLGAIAGIAVLLVVVFAGLKFSEWNKAKREVREAQERLEYARFLTDSLYTANRNALQAGQLQGAAPLWDCYPPKPNASGDKRTFVIRGDEKYDAIVFIYNNAWYVGQVYVAAGTKLEWEYHLIKAPISTLIVFGKEWDREAKNPCDENGWFTGPVLYAGFSSYATDPFPVDLREGHAGFNLKRSRLAKSRELSEADFFDLLRRYGR